MCVPVQLMNCYSCTVGIEINLAICTLIILFTKREKEKKKIKPMIN